MGQRHRRRHPNRIRIVALPLARRRSGGEGVGVGGSDPLAPNNASGHLPFTTYHLPTMTTNPPTAPLQPLRGWVSTFYVKTGSKRFGPYHVRTWKKGRKIYKEYVKPADLEKVKAACQAYKEKRKRQRAKDKELINTFANLNYLVKLSKRQGKVPLRPEDIEHMRNIMRYGYAIPNTPSLRNPASKQPSNRKRFMVPFFTNKKIARVQRDLYQIFDNRQPKESPNQKWLRLEKSFEQPPQPIPQLTKDLPDWYSDDLLEEALSANATHRARAAATSQVGNRQSAIGHPESAPPASPRTPTHHPRKSVGSNT